MEFEFLCSGASWKQEQLQSQEWSKARSSLHGSPHVWSINDKRKVIWYTKLTLLTTVKFPCYKQCGLRYSRKHVIMTLRILLCDCFAKTTWADGRQGQTRITLIQSFITCSCSIEDHGSNKIVHLMRNIQSKFGCSNFCWCLKLQNDLSHPHFGTYHTLFVSRSPFQFRGPYSDHLMYRSVWGLGVLAERNFHRSIVPM